MTFKKLANIDRLVLILTVCMWSRHHYQHSAHIAATAHTYLAAAAAVQCDDSGAGACAEQWPVQCRSTHTADMSFFGDIKDKMEDWAEDKLEEALNSISQDGELDDRWWGFGAEYSW